MLAVILQFKGHFSQITKQEEDLRPGWWSKDFSHEALKSNLNYFYKTLTNMKVEAFQA